MSSTPKGQVPRLRTAAERERHDVVDLQPIAGAAAPPAVPVDIAATTLVAPPHLPLHGAYWEAGYADALDKPVIYICEKSKFKTKPSHFDTNHSTTIFWEKGKDSDNMDFRRQLIATLRRSLDLFD